MKPNEKIQLLLEDNERLECLVYDFNKLIEHNNNEIKKSLNLDYGVIIIGYWDCDKSPIGVCVYNNDDDPMCDSCVYCGDPEERK